METRLTFADRTVLIAETLGRAAREHTDEGRAPALGPSRQLLELSDNLASLVRRKRRGSRPTMEGECVDAAVLELVRDPTLRQLLGVRHLVAVEEHVDCLRFESRTVFAVVARSVLVLVDEGVLGADPKRRAREVRRVDGIRNQRLVQREFEAREAIAAELAKLDAAARILAGAAAAFVGIAGERFAETNRRVA